VTVPADFGEESFQVFTHYSDDFGFSHDLNATTFSVAVQATIRPQILAILSGILVGLPTIDLAFLALS
jgi:hypothetical protein